MVWMTHVSTATPGPFWVIHPARLTSLYPRMTDLTPEMLQTLGRLREVIAENTFATINDQIATRWKRRGIWPWTGLQSTCSPARTEVDRGGTNRDTPAEQFCKYERNQNRMWNLHSPQHIVCGEKLENRLYSTGPYQKCEELAGSSRPRNQGDSEPAPVRVWREIRAVG